MSTNWSVLLRPAEWPSDEASRVSCKKLFELFEQYGITQLTDPKDEDKITELFAEIVKLFHYAWDDGYERASKEAPLPPVRNIVIDMTEMMGSTQVRELAEHLAELEGGENASAVFWKKAVEELDTLPNIIP